MRASFAVLLLTLLCGSAPGLAQQAVGSKATAPEHAGLVREMDTVTITGVQPGPGLWRVRKGDHVLYVFGTQSPLPKDITWRSDEVQQVLRLAERVLGPPGINLDADIGFFRGIVLLPSALKATRIPEDQRLQDVLPAETYARWLRLKQRYIGRDNGIEKKRPLIAAFQLYQKALERSGLMERNVVKPLIDRAVKARKLKPISTTLQYRLEDPK